MKNFFFLSLVAILVLGSNVQASTQNHDRIIAGFDQIAQEAPRQEVRQEEAPRQEEARQEEAPQEEEISVNTVIYSSEAEADAAIAKENSVSEISSGTQTSAMFVQEAQSVVRADGVYRETHFDQTQALQAYDTNTFVSEPVQSSSCCSGLAAQSAPMMAQSAPMMAQSAPMMAQSAPMMAQSAPMMAQSAPMMAQSNCSRNGVVRTTIVGVGSLASNIKNRTANASRVLVDRSMARQNCRQCQRTATLNRVCARVRTRSCARSLCN